MAAAALGIFVVTLLAKLPGTTLASPKDAFAVGLVFDVGGLGDKSFNDSAYRGLQRAEHELGIKTTTIEPGDGSDRAAALRMLAASGHRLIFGVGFIFTDDIVQVAQDFPSVDFAGIDFALRYDKNGAPLPLPPNVVALKFREEEGSYLAGALAAMVSTTHQLGFVGGMDIPLIHKFSAGYRAGALAECPSCEVRVLFSGMTPVAFKDPGKGHELALSQYQSGVDVIYHAAGGTGLGVFQAARETKNFAIGVDSDQSAEAPEVILTSMVKRIDTAVIDTVAGAKNGKFTSGVRWFGLKEDGLELAENVHNQIFLTAARRERLLQLKAAIVHGDIRVPDHD